MACDVVCTTSPFFKLSFGGGYPGPEELKIVVALRYIPYNSIFRLACVKEVCLLA